MTIIQVARRRQQAQEETEARQLGMEVDKEKESLLVTFDLESTGLSAKWYDDVIKWWYGHMMAQCDGDGNSVRG